MWQVACKVSVPFHEVDTHNIVPVWEASTKRETGARTIRTKIHKALGEYLIVRTPLCLLVLAGCVKLVRRQSQHP